MQLSKWTVLKNIQISKYELYWTPPGLEEYSIPTDSSMPDHSLLCWDFHLEQHELVEIPPQHSMPTSQDRPPLQCKPDSAAFKMNSDANRQ